MKNITKLYAAYKTGFLGNNILDTYFSFFANIMIDTNLNPVDEQRLASLFQERYNIILPLPFVRQVLGIGIQNGSIISAQGRYNISRERLLQFSFNNTDFEINWNKLIKQFEKYCKENGICIPEKGTEVFILSIIDDSDDAVLFHAYVEDYNGIEPLEYAWYSFIQECSLQDTLMFSFIASICASNIAMQALFYSSETPPDYSGLHIYLDSPMIFALLGMDVPERTESYLKLVSVMQKAKCSVHVLDHNFQEVEGIILRAADWATSTQYDIGKANNAARFFHDKAMSSEEITEFYTGIETQLNAFGVTVKTTSYDIYQDRFQEDENELLEMLVDRYSEKGLLVASEKDNSIKVDVRSIIMIYRERQGQTSTRIENSKHLMLTTNNVIANISKKYESNRSITAGHIPPCISADLFGAIIWLASPMEMMSYQKKKLLADCFDFLKPDSALLERYVKSLDEARKADEIDEKKFLLLRNHPVVLDALMSITRGDYARFNSNTYLEVYDEIVAQSQKNYKDEMASHSLTLEALEKEKGENAMLGKQLSALEGKMGSEIKELKDELKRRDDIELEKRVTFWGWTVSLALFGVPYIVLIGIIELLKARFSDVSLASLIAVIALLVIGVVALTLFEKGKTWCFSKVRKKICDGK